MMKTFSKFIAIMLTFAFLLSIVPVGVMANTLAEDGTETTIRLSNPVRTYAEGTIADYGTTLRGGAAAIHDKVYRAFFQIDFSGREYLLYDETTEVSLYLAPGTADNTTSTNKLYGYHMYILADKNDAYADYYEPYSDASNGMSWEEVKAHISWLTSTEGLTPFVSRINSSGLNYKTEYCVSEQTNMQVLYDALNASTDDSVITLQFIAGESVDNKANGQFRHSNENTYLKISCTNSDATPENYLNAIAKELSWSKLSADPEKAVVNSVELPTKYKGVEIEWTSSNPAAISSSGEVTMLESSSQPVVLTANMKYTDYNKAEYTYDSVYNLTVAKIPTEYPVTNDGSVTFGVGNNSSGTGICTSNPEANGVGGKLAEHDSYNNVVDSSGTKYVRPFTGGIPSDGGDVDRDIVEFSFCVPATIKFSEISFNIFESGTDRTTRELYIYSDGIYTTGGELIKPIKSNRWYNAALIAPISGSNDDIWTLYINSQYAYGFKWNATSNGVNYMGIRGHSVDENDTAIYIDNLKTYNGEFNAQYSKESIAEYDGIDLNGGTITLTKETTAEDIINNMIVDADANIRIYNPAGELIEDMTTVLADGYTVVVAAKCGTYSERSYSYYEIRVMDSGDIAFDVPFINLDGSAVKGNIKVFNYSGKDAVYKVFLAVYNDDEFIGIADFEELTAEDGKITEFTTSGSAFASGNTAKLFVWEEDEITPELASVIYK